MPGCVVHQSRLLEEAAASGGRVAVELRGTRALVTYRQTLVEPLTGHVREDAKVTFEGARQFGQRVEFVLPLRLQVHGGTDADAGLLCALVTEWLLELADG